MTTVEGDAPPQESIDSELHPPKPRLAFRVGVVGHLPARLAAAKPDMEQLATAVRDVLEEIRAGVEAHGRECAAYYRAGEPQLRLVTSLAEGGDRIVAKQALALRYSLVCPMPFRREEFIRDFAATTDKPDTKHEFDALLEKARNGAGLVCFEFDCAPDDRPAAYALAGEVLMNQSDLMIAIWDGAPSRGPGGSAETMLAALRVGTPVVWVDARAPHERRVLSDLGDLQRALERAAPIADQGAISRLVQDWLRPPAAQDDARSMLSEVFGRTAKNARPRDPIAQYFAETKPARNPWLHWKFFRAFASGGALPTPTTFQNQWQEVAPLTERVDAEWRASRPEIVAWLNGALALHYAWSDQRGDLYADRYRSSFLINFALGACAVLLALLAYGAGWDHLNHPYAAIGCAAAETLVIGTIITLTLWGRLGRWQERWMGYRILAERVRHLRAWAPLGGAHRRPRMPAHLSAYGDPEGTWMAWIVRAIERDVGLPDAVVDRRYLREYGVAVAERLVCGKGGQRRFHRINLERSKAIEHSLQRWTTLCFAATAIACGAHLLDLSLEAAGLAHLPHFAATWLTVACAALPAIGAACVAIRNQGEFQRVARRSHGMVAHLKGDAKALRETVRLLSPRAQPPPRVAAIHPRLCEHVARLTDRMVDEVLDWRVIFQDRRLETS
jgi:hypothetical protein